MKRKIAIAAGILVTAVSTISGSYAYYQDSVTVTNHISTGDVNIGIQEYEKDGDTEKFTQDLQMELCFHPRAFQRFLVSRIMRKPATSG